MEELPAILVGVDLLETLGVEVEENVTWDVAKLQLRRLFLQGAKRSHPDKQTSTGDSSTNVAFARLKAAYDFLQSGSNFEHIYQKAQTRLKAEKLRKQRSKGIAAQQATYLDALLEREKRAQFQEHKKRKADAYYKQAQEEQEQHDQDYGVLIVAAKTLDIALSSQLNILLLSSHFMDLFQGYGIVQIEPLENIHEHQSTNIPVAKAFFTSHQHAIKALLYYRNSRQKFRCDLYALALGSRESHPEPKASTTSLQQLEARVFGLIRARQKARVTL
ncbi:bifunctional DnaJ domain/Chaperone J-domain superfamily [Babesia duncani]|uniref:Bifunctional DnaJ domain/Chaperone J-domain superfamily n=1 Tax=Babesia duncani TaxID=323732 RepID=A0AAD9UP30_9APIC|nr:bifunctional DnaJ domain/Chaperone J-domain superfamily [Babesia duncani]